MPWIIPWLFDLSCSNAEQEVEPYSARMRRQWPKFCCSPPAPLDSLCSNDRVTKLGYMRAKPMAEKKPKFSLLAYIGGGVAWVAALSGAVQAYYARQSYSLQAVPPGASQHVTFAPEAKVGLTDDTLRALRTSQVRAEAQVPSGVRKPVQATALGGKIEAREQLPYAANRQRQERESVYPYSTEAEPGAAFVSAEAGTSSRLATQPQEVTLDHD